MRVLLVSNLRKFTNIKELYNLFSYFGDVVKILFLKYKFNAMIEFSSMSEASKAL